MSHYTPSKEQSVEDQFASQPGEILPYFKAAHISYLVMYAPYRQLLKNDPAKAQAVKRMAAKYGIPERPEKPYKQGQKK